MKTILIGRKHDETDWEVIAGPEVTIGDQLTIRSDLMSAMPINNTWAEVHHLSADEHIKGKLSFLTSEQAVDAASANRRADVGYKNARAEAEERQRVSEKAALNKKSLRHQDEVARISKLNDSIRNSIAPANPRADKIRKELDKELARQDSQQSVTNPAADLSTKTDDELLAIFTAENDKLPPDKQIQFSARNKDDVIEHILKIQSLLAAVK